MPRLRQAVTIRPDPQGTIETRPRDAMPDFGDFGYRGYVPGPDGSGRRARDARPGEVPRPIRNGLPAARPYITPTLATWMEAHGQPVPPGVRRYQGTGHDWLRGLCQCGQQACEYTSPSHLSLEGVISDA
jgi:hypothetical protein